MISLAHVNGRFVCTILQLSRKYRTSLFSGYKNPYLNWLFKTISSTKLVAILNLSSLKTVQSYLSNVIIIFAAKALIFHTTLTCYWKRKAPHFSLIHCLISCMTRNKLLKAEGTYLLTTFVVRTILNNRLLLPTIILAYSPFSMFLL